MKYLEEFRNKEIVKNLVARIQAEAGEIPAVKFMEVCGTHTMSIARFGIRRLLPENIDLISGPGCPVCVTPNRYLDQAIALSRLPGVTLTTFGDMIRVPGSSTSLEKEKATGRDIRVVYSPTDALQIAEQLPEREVIFLGVGFETTVPTIAAAILIAHRKKLKNFSVLCAHKTIPGPMELLASGNEVQLDGFICPAHVTAIIGAKSYRSLAEKFGKACVVTGFEPVDIVQGVLLLMQQIKSGQITVQNQYSRVATEEGNPAAQQVIREVFEPCDAEWRGLGMIPQSGLKINERYREFDAEQRFQVEVEPTREHRSCICGLVMKGVKKPFDCKLFGKVCTPENPVGACMVSSEGTCAAYYKYDRI
ncbi:MAG: hydrogenase formation protein HypD [Calditrichia bacterium]